MIHAGRFRDRITARGATFPAVAGRKVMLADILAFAPLVRFDAVYNPLFRATRKRLVDDRHLAAFVKRVHDLPGVAETVRLDHILAHYYDGDWAVAHRRGIVPEVLVAAAKLKLAAEAPPT